ncbi:transcriptional regulator swi6 [Irineochytrium annulatum]|nr:transcriptional regulator swi6 [Irineochytrium annulatum]
MIRARDIVMNEAEEYSSSGHASPALELPVNNGPQQLTYGYLDDHHQYVDDNGDIQRLSVPLPTFHVDGGVSADVEHHHLMSNDIPASTLSLIDGAKSPSSASVMDPRDYAPSPSHLDPMSQSSKPVVLVAKPRGVRPMASSVYQATYSGIPVYEMMCKNIAMMRRRSDSYLNATQILKAAGIDKGKRTKILDKEIAQGQHEKVQGGYGKYQGTWIPFERGVQLAQQYDVLQYIRPLIDYEPAPLGRGDKTPTKEQYNATLRREDGNQVPRRAKRTHEGRPHTQAPLSSHQIIVSQPTELSYHDPSRPEGQYSQESLGPGPGPTGELSSAPDSPLSSPSVSDAESDTWSPMGGQSRKKAKTTDDGQLSQHHYQPQPQIHQSQATQQQQQQQQQERQQRAAESHNAYLRNAQALSGTNMDRHRAFLMAIFLDDSPGSNSGVPQAISDPSLSPDLDVDIVIDDQGHTSLHWAAALGRINMVRALIERGANVRAVNYAGETALIRAVLVTNSYETQSFPEVVDVLGETLSMEDAKGRTVLHHITLTAGIRGRIQASKYYLECILDYMAKGGNPAVMSSVLDMKDRHGDTALNVAARIGNRNIMEQLLNVGANPLLDNYAGLRPSDFGGFDDLWANMSKGPISNLLHRKPALVDPQAAGSGGSAQGDRQFVIPPYSYDTGPAAGTSTLNPKLCQFQLTLPDEVKLNEKRRHISDAINQMIGELNDSFAADLRGKHELLNETQLQLRDVTRELSEVRRQNTVLRVQTQKMPELTARLRALEKATSEKAASSSNTTTGNTKIHHEPFQSNHNRPEHDHSAFPSVNPQTSAAVAGPVSFERVLELEERLALKEEEEIRLRQELSDLRDAQMSRPLTPPVGGTPPPAIVNGNGGGGNGGAQAMGNHGLGGASIRELQCKRIIAACCSIPLEAVDGILDSLLEAVESEVGGDLDLSVVATFLSRTNASTRQGEMRDAGSAPPSNNGSTR